MVRCRRNNMHSMTNALRIGNVERNKCCHRASFQQRLGCLFPVPEIARAEKNVKALVAELPSNFVSNPLVSSSHQGSLHVPKLRQDKRNHLAERITDPSIVHQVPVEISFE